MIIVEGPDGSGKSTLIEALGYTGRKVRALRAGVGATRPDGICSADGAEGWASSTDDAPTAYARAVLSALVEEHEGGPAIAFDRFHLSEVVYGPLLRGESGISDAEVTLLTRFLYARGVVTFLCLPAWETTYGNVCQEGRERPAFQTPEFLRDAYDRFAGLSSILNHYQAVGYNYKMTPSPTFLVPMLTRPQAHPDVIGAPSARFLFIGGRPDHPLGLPFFSTQESDGYVNQAIKDVGISEHQLSFTSAFDLRGKPRDLHAIIEANQHLRQVIVIGDRAQQEVHRQNIRILPTRMIPDPGYWRRYCSGDYVGYCHRLHDAQFSV